MRLTLLFCAIILVTTCQGDSIAYPAVIQHSVSQELVAILPNIVQFSDKLFQIASRNKTENIILSPISPYVALTAIAYGARGNTAEEIRSALQLPVDDKIAKEAHKLLTDFIYETISLDENKESKNMAKPLNKLYISKRYNVKTEFQELLKNILPLKLEQLDFENSENAANSINNWISEETNGGIKDIVKTGNLNSRTSMFLTNSFYFKGEWEYSFYKDATVISPFYTVEKNYSVPMMNRKGLITSGAIPDLKATFVELVYQNYDFIMIIILPDEIDGLEEMEQKLETMTLKSIRKMGHFRLLDLNVPKFKVENTIEMKDILQQMGLKEMFTESANFSGISDSSIHIDNVFQKSIIEVDEGSNQIDLQQRHKRDNTIAKLPTPWSNEPFNVNHPFHFKIIKPGEDQNDVVIFAGNCKSF